MPNNTATSVTYVTPTFEQAKVKSVAWDMMLTISFDGHYWTLQSENNPSVSRIITKEQALELADLWEKWDAEYQEQEESFLRQECEC